jgi:hypothetical protein
MSDDLRPSVPLAAELAAFRDMLQVCDRSLELDEVQFFVDRDLD